MKWGSLCNYQLKSLGVKKIYASRFKDAFGSESITGERIIKALSQFERTLVSADSRYDKYLRGEYQPTLSELNGITLFYTNPNLQKYSRS